MSECPVKPRRPTTVGTIGCVLTVVFWVSILQPSRIAAEVWAVGDIQFLPNGDFEQGATVWSQSSTHGFQLIRHLSEVGATARSGLWGAVFGLVDSETAYIEQQVQIPIGSPTVGYWYQLGSVDTHLGFDFARIIVNGTDVIDEFHLHDDENTTVWTQRTADISTYAGQTINVRLELENDISEPSTLLVDDVYFDSSGVPDEIFADGFESGDTSAWSNSSP